MSQLQRCELCAKVISAAAQECPDCSRVEIQEEIEKMLNDTIQYLEKNHRSKSEAQILFRLGNFYRLSGRYEEAKKCYENALAIDEAEAEYFRSYGTTLVLEKDYKAAIEMMRKAADLRPHFADIRSDLGAAFFKDGQFEEAIREFQEAVRINPEYANAYNNLGLAYRKKRMFAESEQAIRRAIELDPQHAIANYELGLAYFSGGMFSQIHESLKINSKQLGDLYFMQDKYDEALHQYQKALELHPRYADIYFAMARTYLGKKDAANARISLQKSLEINPNYKDAAQLLTEIESSR